MSYSTYSRRPRSNYSRPKYSKQSTKQYINPSRFVQAAKSVETVAYIPQNKFADFEMHALLKANVISKGYVDPTPIQDQAIPLGLSGKDIVGVANTGTGKTVAFAIPILHNLISDQNSRVLIMAPTRELAQQIEVECRSLARNSGLNGAILIGGASMMHQLRDLKARPRIVIGTPGRIKDHLERGSLDLSLFNHVVLDEVDRMLDMGFINDMKIILTKLSDKRQSFFFSATMDSKVRSLINAFVHEPSTISVKTGETCDNVEQNVIGYQSKSDKIGKLHDLLIKNEVLKTLVFDDTQRGVERLHQELLARGFESDAIHGGKNQGQRQRALKRFKDNHINILVATDVAARGIDVTDISHVINYSTPQTYDDYVHRIGRAGRAGRSGMALTFIEI